MALAHAVPETPGVDTSPIGWAPWLTHRRLVLFVIGWLALFAVIGAFVSNPFQSETSASAAPDYARVMFLHGLLIGMVGLMALLTCQVMQLRSTHVRLWIAAGTVVATILAAVGGIWDKTIPGSEVPMWTQIFGFFALDEILLMLLVGMILEWRRSPISHSLTYVAAACAAVAMMAAALMGHLAGWIMEFGWTTPPIIKDFATFAGFGTQDDFTAALVGSHSHEMAVGAMALAITLLAQQFGYAKLAGTARLFSRIGVALIAIGTLAMTAIYVVSAVSQWGPPTMFQSADGTNGIAGDDVVTGILVMGGGLLVALSFALLRSVLRQPTRVAALWAWVLSFVTVVVAGFAIELNETYFGAGDATAPGAAKDAVFTWLHQDLGLFLLPALVLVMLAADTLVIRRWRGLVGWAAIIGMSIAFAGGLVWVFVDPALHGPGYIVSTVGMIFIGVALLAMVWCSSLTATPRPVQTPQPPETPQVEAAPEPERILAGSGMR